MDFISVKDASQILSCSEQHIRLLIREGKLPGEKIGIQWVLPSNVLELSVSRNNSEKEVNDRPRKKSRIPKVKALSFFSGAMGMDIGLEKVGIKVLLASEIDKKCRETIKENHPNIALIGDIRDYSATDIRSFAGLNQYEEIDLVVGGPPCQAFSTAGKRKGFEDERGNVFLVFIERILKLRPKYAVIENVRGLLSAPLTHRPHDKRGGDFPSLSPDEEKGGALLHIVKKLESAGYGVSFNLYNAANFGTPQKRERVILICSRDGSKAPFLTPTHSETGLYNLKKWKTFRQAVLGLKDHDYINFPEKRLKYYRLLEAGQYWRNLPGELQKEALGVSYYSGGGKTGFLRRIPWDAPAPTLVTHPAMPATDLAHPVKDRPLSVQEYKRVQEFPDTYKICGTKIDQYKQIGNAVPCGLGSAVGRIILSLLNNEEVTQYPNFPYSRYKGTCSIGWMKEIEKNQYKERQGSFF